MGSPVAGHSMFRAGSGRESQVRHLFLLALTDRLFYTLYIEKQGVKGEITPAACSGGACCLVQA